MSAIGVAREHITQVFEMTTLSDLSSPSSLLSSGSLIYEKLGERAFGWPGKMAAFVSITLQNIGGELENNRLDIFNYSYRSGVRLQFISSIS